MTPTPPVPPPSLVPAPPPQPPSLWRRALVSLLQAPPWARRIGLNLCAAALLAYVPHIQCQAGRDVATAVARELRENAAELSAEDAGTSLPVSDGGAGVP